MFVFPKSVHHHPGMPADLHSVQVSHLTDTEQKSLYNFLKWADGRLIEAPTWRVFLVQRNDILYLRRAPGAGTLEKVLGKSFFKLFGSLVSVGLQVYEDARRSDLTAAERLGRTSWTLLMDTNPLTGLLWMSATVLFPDQTDQYTKWFFSNKNPVIEWTATKIFQLGGKPFQDWSTKPSWVDYVNRPTSIALF